VNLLDILKPSLLGRAAKTAIRPVAPLDRASARVVPYTFGDLDSLSQRLAAFLESHGVRKGDRICAYLPNSPWVAVTLLAAWRLGAIYVPINSLYRRREVAHVLADCDPKALVLDPTLRGFAEEALADCGRKPLLLEHPGDLERAANETSALPSACHVGGDDPAGIFYTSGTTGRAKGAVLTHNNLSFNAMVLHACWQWRESDVLALGLPLSHLHGLANGLLGALLAGAEILLLERLVAERVAVVLEEGGATLFFGVPTVFARLVAPEVRLARRDLSRVRLFVSGSAPLPAELHERFFALTGHRILERYGLTEALMVASNPYAGERRAGSVGLALAGVSVKIVTSSGKEAEDGEEGELWVKGPNVFRGYWRNRDATREALSGGWLKTGDIATRSADGYITIRGRAKELIICGGFNIYPREVEEVIEAAPGVEEAAVAGMPHPAKGEVPAAFVVAKGGQSLDWGVIADHCRRHLAEFKVPRSWHQVKELPRNSLGKILRAVLVQGTWGQGHSLEGGGRR